jgi:hypothetical protein
LDLRRQLHIIGTLKGSASNDEITRNRQQNEKGLVVFQQKQLTSNFYHRIILHGLIITSQQNCFSTNKMIHQNMRNPSPQLITRKILWLKAPNLSVMIQPDSVNKQEKLKSRQ